MTSLSFARMRVPRRSARRRGAFAFASLLGVAALLAFRASAQPVPASAPTFESGKDAGHAVPQANAHTDRTALEGGATDMKGETRHAAAAETARNSRVPHDPLYGERLPGSSERLGLWWASSGWKISQACSLPEAAGAALTIRAARNEAEAAQLILRPAADMTLSAAVAGPLKGPGGAEIPASAVELLRVMYVTVMRPTDASSQGGAWPDPLPPFDRSLALKVGCNQPLWVRVTVPRGIPAGAYSGAIRLRGEGVNAEAPIRVEVYGFDLPDRMTCETAFGFDPGMVFQYHNVKDPDQQRALLEKYWKDLSAHHVSPYDPAPLDPFAVAWPALGIGPDGKRDKANDPSASTSKTLDAASFKPVFDWAAWDAAVKRAFDHYHFNTLRLPMKMLGGKGASGAKDPKLIRQPSFLGFPGDSKEFDSAFGAYARGIQEHLREKGWLDKAYVYWFDEPDKTHYEFVRTQLLRLKEAAPDLRRMLTEQVEPALVGGPTIWDPLSNRYNHAAAQERRKHGEHFWWYVCTGPKAPYATLFIDHPGTEMRVWLWQTWQRGIDGVLIWRVNHWTQNSAYPDKDHPQNPYADPMSWSPKMDVLGRVQRYGNGDGRFIYPPLACADGRPSRPVMDAPVDSIRWEMLRDGIEDYEYLAMLKRAIAERGANLPKEDRARAEALLEVPAEITSDTTTFTKSPAPIESRRDAIAREIEALR